MEIESGEISEIDMQLNALESEIKNLENSIIIKDLSKFTEIKNKILIIQKKIQILTK